MADLRSYVLGVAIADNLATPSNDTQAVATFLMNYDGANWDMARGDATNGLLVNLGANNDVTVTGTVTVTDDGLFTLAANSGVDIGDVDVTSVIPLTGATNLGKAIDTAVGGTDTGVGALAVRDDALGGITPVEGDWTSLLVDANGALWVNVNNTVTVDTELPAAAALADDTANPTVPGVGGFLLGYDSGNTNWNRVEVDDAGHLQVDVLTGGGSDSPTTPATDYVTSASLAAGGNVDLDTADLGTQELWAVQVWSSVAYKALVYTVENSSPSAEPLAIGGGQAHQGWEWQVPHRDFVSVSTTAGTDGFRVNVTNLDDSNAADVYCTFQYSAS
jgi:hypothetical protein